jgi:hypothetical protein
MFHRVAPDAFETWFREVIRDIDHDSDLHDPSINNTPAQWNGAMRPRKKKK